MMAFLQIGTYESLKHEYLAYFGKCHIKIKGGRWILHKTQGNLDKEAYVPS